jgi:hypothetical protein
MTMTGDQDNNTADVNAIVKPQAANQRSPRRSAGHPNAGKID